MTLTLDRPGRPHNIGHYAHSPLGLAFVPPVSVTRRLRLLPAGDLLCAGQSYARGRRSAASGAAVWLGESSVDVDVEPDGSRVYWVTTAGVVHGRDADGGLIWTRDFSPGFAGSCVLGPAGTLLVRGSQGATLLAWLLNTADGAILSSANYGVPGFFQTSIYHQGYYFILFTDVLGARFLTRNAVGGDGLPGAMDWSVIPGLRPFSFEPAGNNVAIGSLNGNFGSVTLYAVADGAVVASYPAGSAFASSTMAIHAPGDLYVHSIDYDGVTLRTLVRRLTLSGSTMTLAAEFDLGRYYGPLGFIVGTAGIRYDGSSIVVAASGTGRGVTHCFNLFKLRASDGALIWRA